MLRNIKIGRRIAAGLVPPVVVILLLTGLLVWHEVETAREARRLGESAELAVAANSAIHEIQRERGASSLFLGSKGTQFGTELAQQRTDTDRKVAQLSSALDGLGSAVLAIVSSPATNAAKGSLRAIADLRARVDRQEIAPTEAVASYTETVTRLIDLVARSRSAATDMQSIRLVTALIEMTEAKESAGIERAVGAAGFTTGKFDPALLRRFIEVGARQQQSLAQFLRDAPDDATAASAAALNAEVEDPVKRMRAAVYDSQAGGSLGEITGQAWFAAATRRIDALKTVEDHLDAEILKSTSDTRAAAQRALVLLSLVAAVLVSFIAIVMAAVARSIVVPVSDLAGEMSRLSAGDTTVRLPGAEFADEVGDMVRATQIFRENSETRRRLEAEHVEAERQSADKRRRMLNGLADQFEATVKSKVGEVADASVQIGRTSGNMADNSNKNGGRSMKVAEAAAATKELAAVVSAATQELSASVNEIAGQVAKSSTIARQAVTDVSATTSQMEALSTAVNAIGEIVGLISDIASQTNLLALNATIEAARAGEAGKGFAVVAGEVKSLANQTARATDDITRQVAAIQESTRRMNENIEGVAGTIRSIDEYSSAIASAVQQQGAATQEIAANIENVARYATDVTLSVTQLSKATISSCAGTVRVLWSADVLASIVQGLRSEVDGFVAVVRSDQTA